MPLINQFRTFCSFLIVAGSVVIFVGCQREPEEILEEDPPPASDSNSHRLKAIHIIEGLETEDTAITIQFDYDNLNRLTKMTLTTVGSTDLDETWFFYNGSSELPYLRVGKSATPIWDIYGHDSSFLLYDQGMIVYDSTRSYTRPISAPQNLEFKGYDIFQYFSISSILFRIKHKFRTVTNPGNTDYDWEREVVIAENNANTFHATASQLAPTSNYSGFTKLEFSSFKNPFAGLIPAPIVADPEDPNWYLLSGFFPQYPSRSQNDPNDLSQNNHRVIVLKHVDFYPVHVQLENYNDLDDYPYEIWLYEYE